MEQVTLDTDALSHVMRGRDHAVMQWAERYLREHRRFTFSIITEYEILRGLHSKQAAIQIERFENLCTACEILPLDQPVVRRAAAMYGDLRREGLIVGDADILIAATAMTRELPLLTLNVNHFKRFPGLRLSSWAKP